jgi:hypothetical protein
MHAQQLLEDNSSAHCGSPHYIVVLNMYVLNVTLYLCVSSLVTCMNLIGVPRKTNDNTAVLTGCSVLYTVTVVGGTIFNAHA